MSPENEEKRYYDDDSDLISKLPDEVIHLILSRLSTTEQVFRAKVLSKRWRCLLSSLLPLPSIDIDCSRGGGFYKKEEFNKFVSWALANRCGGDLESFRLSCLNTTTSEEVEQWIKAAVIQNIKQLHLTFKPPIIDQEINLLHALVSSHSLKVFKLLTFRCPLSLPTSKGGFPALRVLELNNVKLLDPFSLEKLVTTCCPLLEDLSLVDCVIHKLPCIYISSPTLKTLRIDNRKLVDDDEEGLCSKLAILCPKLVFFEYGGHVAKLPFLHLPSLKKAVIYPQFIPHKKITPELGQTVSDLFAGASTAQSLSINYYFVQCISAADDHLLSLPNLNTLELTAPMIDSITINLLSMILEIAPKLESIHWVIQQGLTSQQFQTLVRLLDDMATRHILTPYLKRVEFIEFNGEREVLDVAQFLLERLNALEELVFSWHNKLKYDDKSMEAMNEVSKFYKASPSVKLITLLNN